MTEEQLRRSRPADEPPADEPTLPPPTAPAAQDFSQILDDIDDILEENALTFVQGFVQEGGE